MGVTFFRAGYKPCGCAVRLKQLSGPCFQYFNTAILVEQGNFVTTWQKACGSRGLRIGLQLQQWGDLGVRQGGEARHGHGTDPVLWTAGHGKCHDHLVALLAAVKRRLRGAVALPAQGLGNAQAGVFQQVLVNGPFLAHGYQVFALAFEGIACEHHANMRTGLDRDLYRDGRALTGELVNLPHPCFVEATTTQVLFVVGHPRLEGVAIEGPTGQQAQPSQHLRLRLTVGSPGPRHASPSGLTSQSPLR